MSYDQRFDKLLSSLVTAIMAIERMVDFYMSLVKELKLRISG